MAAKAFGPVCERIQKMKLKEGSYVNLEGRIDEETWEEKGQKRSRMVIIIDEIEFASNGNGKNGNNGSNGNNGNNGNAVNGGNGTEHSVQNGQATAPQNPQQPAHPPQNPQQSAQPQQTPQNGQQNQPGMPPGFGGFQSFGDSNPFFPSGG